jgi:hypothetical protein
MDERAKRHQQQSDRERFEKKRKMREFNALREAEKEPPRDGSSGL